MKYESKTKGFGAPQEFGSHVFRVEIPTSRVEKVKIIEDFGYKGGENGIPYEEERALLPRTAWSSIADTARRDFNQRLKSKKLAVGSWKNGTNLLDRLLGKELCVLAWAVERAAKEEVSVICSRWLALKPEERWWLFSITAAEAGLSQDTERGWRKAIYFALADGKKEGVTQKRSDVIEEQLRFKLFEEVKGNE